MTTDPRERCQFGCTTTTTRLYRFNAGCACYPDVQEMYLCPQHILVATPIDGMHCIDARGELPWL